LSKELGRFGYFRDDGRIILKTNLNKSEGKDVNWIKGTHITTRLCVFLPLRKFGRPQLEELS
jgi:ribosomal protein S12 methylthiotransferase accessory factor YcaO